MQTPRCERGAAKEKSVKNGTGRHSTSQSSTQEKCCKRCRRAFKPERLAQIYCCARCRNAAVKARLRARSGDLKPRRRRLVLPHREAVTFGQKKPIKTKAIFGPLPRHFRCPVIDFLRRSEDLLRLVISVECRNYPPVYRRPALQGDDIIIESYADGYPKLPASLDRRGCNPFTNRGAT